MQDATAPPPAAAGDAADPIAAAADWKSLLNSDFRPRVLDKILNTLRSQLRISNPDDHNALNKIAIRFEDKIFTAATNKCDYIKKIIQKLQSMETMTGGTAAFNSSLSNRIGGNQIPAESAAIPGMRPQVSNRGKSLAMPSVNQSAVGQLLSQNLQNNSFSGPLPGSSGLPSESSPITGFSQPSVDTIVQTSTMPNMSGVSKNSESNSTGQCVRQKTYANAQSTVPGMQQQLPIMSQQRKSHDQLMFQQHLDQKSMKQIIPHPSVHHPHMELQQKQPSFLQPNQLQSQQPLMQKASSTQSGQSTSQMTEPAMMQSALHANLQCNEQHKVQQSRPSLLQNPQSFSKQQKGQPTMHEQSTSVQQQSTPIPQQPVLPPQKQQQLIGQQLNMSGLQQVNIPDVQQQQKQQQLIGQQSNMSGLQQVNIPDVQQQQKQQQILSTHKNNLMNMQQAHQVHWQQQLDPNYNTPEPHTHQQLLGSQSSVPSMQPHQRSMQQRLQASGAMLQSQNSNEQQNEFIPSLRGLQEVSSSSSMDPTAQTEVSGAVNRQKEIYQKIKSLKKLYFAELRESYQKLALKVQKLESAGVPAKHSEQLNKMKAFKMQLEGVLRVLSFSENNLPPFITEKFPSLERQIMNFIAFHRSKKIAPSQLKSQQYQHPSRHASHLQHHGIHINQFQQVNSQSSAYVQTVHTSSMLHGSVPLPTHVTIPATEPNMENALQPPKLDLIQGSSSSSLQQGAMGPVQQGPNVLQHEHLKQERQERQHQLMQTEHMEQQKQKLLQQLPMQQQLHQQKEQQTMQMPVHQLAQLHQMNDVRKGSGIKSGVCLQHYPGGQSPHNLQALSPQISHPSSPQMDQQDILSSNTKVGSSSQTANSPFIVSSLSTQIVPSPNPGDLNFSGISSLTSAMNFGHQQATLASHQDQSLAVETPGISASPLLAEFISLDGSQANASTSFPSKSNTTESSIDLMVKLVQSLPYEDLSSSICDIGSVVSMTDSIAGSAPGNGSRSAIGQDLAAKTKSDLQVRNFISQDRNAAKRKMNRHTSDMPFNVVSSAGSMNDNFNQSYGLDTSVLESTETSNVKRQKVEANHALVEEIREINQHLIDTVVTLNDEDIDSTSIGSGEGVVVKFSSVAVSLCPSLKSQFSSAQGSAILPLRLLVPTDYPKCSPVLVDTLPVEASVESEAISVKAQSIFSMSVSRLPQPMSLGEMARTWDSSTRKVITEYAQQYGGGSISSSYGAWESCAGA